MTSRATTRTLLAIGGLAGTLAVLAGTGEMLGPPHRAMPWLSTFDDPMVIAIELVRIGSMTGAAWLLALTVAHLVAGGLGLTRLRALIGAMAPAFWRTIVLKPVATLAVIAPPALVPVVATSPVAAEIVDVSRFPPELTMSLEQPGSAALLVASEHPTLTMRLHDPLDVGLPPAPVTDGPASTTSSRTTHVVVSGDNLWSIAASHLTIERGARPTSAEVTPYWQALIEANRHVLPDPENPGLLFPGIELHLPPTA